MLIPSFAEDFAIITRESPSKMKKRSPITDDPSVLKSTFDHMAETFQIYYQHKDSEACNRIFTGGAVDTVIRLPAHAGEGPYARVVSMEPMVIRERDLPRHHRRKRELQGNQNQIYEITVYPPPFQTINVSYINTNARLIIISTSSNETMARP